MSGAGQPPPTPVPSTEIAPQDEYRRQSQDSTFSQFSIGAPAIPHSSSPRVSTSTVSSPVMHQLKGMRPSGSQGHRQNQPSLPSPTTPTGMSGMEHPGHRRSSGPRNGMTPSVLLGGSSVKLHQAPSSRSARELAHKPTVYLDEPPKPPAHIIQHTNYRKRQARAGPEQQEQPKASGSKRRKVKVVIDEDENEDDDDDYEEKQTKAPRKPMQRKTAHSEIERNRRVKMNTASDKLADLIPATKGRQQTKLNILEQAVKYIEYLHDCMAKLKGQVNIVERNANGSSPNPRQTAFNSRSGPVSEASYSGEEDMGRDVSDHFERSEGSVAYTPRANHHQKFRHPEEAVNYHAEEQRMYSDGHAQHVPRHASANERYPQYPSHNYSKNAPDNGDYNSMRYHTYSAASSTSSPYSPHSRSPVPSTGYSHHQMPQNQAHPQQSSAPDPKYPLEGQNLQPAEEQEASEALMNMKNSTSSNQGTMPLSNMLS